MPAAVAEELLRICILAELDEILDILGGHKHRDGPLACSLEALETVHVRDQEQLGHICQADVAFIGVHITQGSAQAMIAGHTRITVKGYARAEPFFHIAREHCSEYIGTTSKNHSVRINHLHFVLRSLIQRRISLLFAPMNEKLQVGKFRIGKIFLEICCHLNFEQTFSSRFKIRSAVSEGERGRCPLYPLQKKERRGGIFFLDFVFPHLYFDAPKCSHKIAVLYFILNRKL